MALMATNTTEEAYKQAGIAQSTAYKYMTDPCIQGRVSQNQKRDHAAGDKPVAEIRINAVRTLNQVMADE